jgi:DNA mismatch repair protein MutS
MKMLEQQRENIPENDENSEKLFKHNVSPKISKENLEKMQQTQVQLFEIAPEPAWERIQTLLKKIDVNAISPIEALLKLNELKNMMK